MATLGIPTVTVPMGTMADIGMPAGLTFAGKAYDDVGLLRMAGDYERATQRRTSPPRTPALADDVFVERPASSEAGKAAEAAPGADPGELAITLGAEIVHAGGNDEIAVVLDIDAGAVSGGAGLEAASVKVHVNGEPVAMRRSGVHYAGRVSVPATTHQRFHSVWRGPYGSIITAIVRLEDGRTAGAYTVTGGIG